MNLRRRGKTYSIDWVKGQVRVRGSLGIRSKDAAERVKNRLETAIADGPKSPIWMELVEMLPERTYKGFANALGIKQTRPHTWGDLSRSLKDDMALRVKLESLSPKTQTRYESVIREFEYFWEEREAKLWLLRDLEGDRGWINEFKLWRVKRIEKNSGTGKGLQMDLAVLHTIFEHAIEQDWIKRNPVRVKYPRNANFEGGADPFNPSELARFRQHLDEDEMPFLLLRHTGLREGDAVSITFQQINFSTKEMDIITQKFRKRVILPLHPELMFALKRERARRNAQPGDTILINPNTSAPFGEQSLYSHIKALGKRSGVPNSCSHRFRDTKAADLFLQGANTTDVAQALGDTEKVINKHYAQWIPERRERLRGFVENGFGIEGQAFSAALEENAIEIEPRQGRPREISEPQLPFISEETAWDRGSSAIEIAPEKNPQYERCSVSTILPVLGESATAGIESDTAGSNSENAVSRRRVIVHGRSRTYNNGDACIMQTLTCAQCAKDFLRRQGQDPAAKGYIKAYCTKTCYWKSITKRPRGAMIHGTRNAYDQKGCRCEQCRAISSERMKKYRARLKAEGREPLMVTLVCDCCGIEFKRKKGNGPIAKGRRHAYHSPSCYRKAAIANRANVVVVHGTRTAYERHACRCEQCRAAHSALMKTYRAAHTHRKTVSPVFDHLESLQGIDHLPGAPFEAIRTE